jgi:glutaredoxin
MEKVPGSKKDHKVMIFTLSTCGWCKKTKKLLKDLDVEYEYVDIDTLSGKEREKVREELRKHNPRMSAPTVVIDDGKNVIIGFNEEEVREALS